MIMFIASIILIVLKTKYDNNTENFSRQGTPSAGPFNTWQERAEKIRDRGKNSDKNNRVYPISGE